MRAARLLASVAILACFYGVADAQTGCARLSWDTSDPWVWETHFVDPKQYRLVESVFGLNTPNVGTDSQIHFREDRSNPLPDAWRFDDGGCQAGQLALSNDGFHKFCPAMKGTNSYANTYYVINADGSATLRLATSYDAFVPTATTRYTLWQIVFDHSSSNIGPTPPDHSTCGGAETCVLISFDFVRVFTTTAQVLSLPGCDFDSFTCSDAFWDGACVNHGFPCSPVPTAVGTWGRVRATYR